MAKSKEMIYISQEEVPVEVQPPEVLKTYSLDQYAMLKGIPSSNLPGIRAFLGGSASFKFSLQMWDEILKEY